MRSSLLSLVLAVSLAGSALAAGCADTTPMPMTPAGAGSSTGPGGPMTAPPSTSAPPVDTAPPAMSGKGPAVPPPDAASAGGDKPMPPISASKMGDDLKAMGLDIGKLPTMGKLKQPERVKVMAALTKATGLGCNDCHAEDRKKETPLKQIARHMWDDYVVTMKMSDGGPLFCDSCHQGKHDYLTRSNKEAIRKFMDTNYVDKLAQKDPKGQQSCQTCHGQEFEMKIFEKLWKAKRDAPKAEFFLGEKSYIGLLGDGSH